MRLGTRIFEFDFSALGQILRLVGKKELKKYNFHHNQITYLFSIITCPLQIKSSINT